MSGRAVQQARRQHDVCLVSPSVTSTGIGSPVMRDWSRVDRPPSNVPSTGMCSPGETTTVCPGSTENGLLVGNPFEWTTTGTWAATSGMARVNRRLARALGTIRIGLAELVGPGGVLGPRPSA